MTRIGRIYTKSLRYPRQDLRITMSHVCENGAFALAYFEFREYDMAWHRIA